MRNLILVLTISLMTSAAFAGSKAALVKLIKGDAYTVSNGKEIKLKADDWIDGGAVLKTSPKSFVKLVFIDKSQMNIGPSSEIKIEKFHSKDAGVIDLVKGKIRSQVTKDYLQIQGKDRSKLFIKTRNAVMGIRGTDFMISTNGKNTAAILFEGEVVFNRLNDRGISDSAKLDEIVDRGVRMFPGEFSAVGENGAPTVPALLNVHQRERLEKNGNFERSSSASVAKNSKSVVPAGLPGNVVASKPNIDVAKSDENKLRASSNPDSYVKDGQIKPVNGSFVHLDSATIIAPGKDAVLDTNTNTYIASDKAGSVSSDGVYNPPKGIDIKLDGTVLISSGASVAPQEVAPNSVPIALVNQNPADQSAKLDVQVGDTVNDYKERTGGTALGSDSTFTPTGPLASDPGAVGTDGGSSSGSSSGTTSGTSSGVIGGVVDGASDAVDQTGDTLRNSLNRLGL